MQTWSLSRLTAEDLGIYLGTPSTWVCSRSKGLVVVEPTLVAVSKRTNRIEAVGNAARLLARKAYGVEAVSPAKENVIEDSEAAESFLRHLYQQATGRRFWVRPRVLFPIPGYSTYVERRALIHAAQRAGASRVFLVSNALTAALGAGVPIAQSNGTMVLHIGRFGTEASIFSSAVEVSRYPMPIGTRAMDMAIVERLKRKYNLQITLATAERVRAEIGTAYPFDEDIEIQVNGRGTIEGGPKSHAVRSSEVREALADPLSIIIEGVRFLLERAPVEFAADIVDTGIRLSGDGALLRGIDRRLQEELKLSVSVADNPLATSLLGTMEYLSSWNLESAEPFSSVPEVYDKQALGQKAGVAAILPDSSRFHSCFISYSHADGGFAERLHSDLEEAGVVCFFAPKNLSIGALTRPALDENVRRHDKLLLILSKHSVRSQWVEQEVESALAKERAQGQMVLFPVRIDDSILEHQGGWPELIRNTRHIGDFTKCTEATLYRQSFERLLHDLRPSAH